MRQAALFILLAFAPASVFPSVSAAYDITKEKQKFVTTYTADLDGDGLQETVKFIKKSPSRFPDGTSDYATITVESKGQVFTKKIPGDISVQNSGILPLRISDTVKPFILVTYLVPFTGHIWHATLFSFNGQNIAEELSVMSNEPSIEIVDTNGDNILDIVTVQRGIRAGSGSDKVASTYLYKNGKWELSSVVRTKIEGEKPHAKRSEHAGYL